MLSFSHAFAAKAELKLSNISSHQGQLIDVFIVAGLEQQSLRSQWLDLKLLDPVMRIIEDMVCYGMDPQRRVHAWCDFQRHDKQDMPLARSKNAYQSSNMYMVESGVTL